MTRLVFLLSLALCIGCGSGRYPVIGTVKYADGTPLDAGTVIAEGTVDGKLVSVQANVEPDGSFKLGSETPGDGALPGSYKAVVMPVALGDSELAAGKTPAVEGKYTKFETSGIQFEVTKGPNKLDITVSKPNRK